jgi:hypothetical protein
MIQKQGKGDKSDQLDSDHRDKKMTLHFQGIRIVTQEYIRDKDQPQQDRK